MIDFIQSYKKVFCDDKGVYYRPHIRKAFFQNQEDVLRVTVRKQEGTYE